MTSWNDLFRELMSKDPEAQREYERLKPLYALISDALQLRTDLGLTQADVAARMGRQQPSVARFEAGNTNPTLRFLQELAEALGARLTVHFEPIAPEALPAEGAPKRKRLAEGSTDTKRRRGKAVASKP